MIGSPRGSWGAEEEESAGSITPTVVDDGRGETGGTWRGGWRRRLIQQTKAGARFSGPKPTHPLLNPPWGVNPPSDQPQTTQRSAEKKPFERMFSGRFPRAGQSNSQRTARKVGGGRNQQGHPQHPLSETHPPERSHRCKRNLRLEVGGVDRGWGWKDENRRWTCFHTAQEKTVCCGGRLPSQTLALRASIWAVLGDFPAKSAASKKFSCKKMT